MLKMQVEKLGNVTVLHLQGRIVNDVATRTLRQTVLAEANASVMVLDFDEVELIDASGLGTLVELRKWAQSKGVEFRLINVNGLVEQVLEITRLNTVFEISSRAGKRPADDRPSTIVRKTPAMGFES
jgi:anti-sigma B factor antagonist